MTWKKINYTYDKIIQMVKEDVEALYPSMECILDTAYLDENHCYNNSLIVAHLKGKEFRYKLVTISPLIFYTITNNEIVRYPLHPGEYSLTIKYDYLNGHSSYLYPESLQPQKLNQWYVVEDVNAFISKEYFDREYIGSPSIYFKEVE